MCRSSLIHTDRLIDTLCTSRQYRFSCTLTVDSFLYWTAGQLHPIRYGKRRKIPKKQGYKVQWTTVNVPVPYVRLVDQFIKEDKHGDHDRGHEALRRQSYARQMLDMFAAELVNFEGRESNFRSRVLTPVLQRQLQGVPDCYSPAIRESVARTDVNSITISDATDFYLSIDPLDPKFIASYRRNMLYIREARWHLSIVMEKTKVEDTSYFNIFIEDHDLIMRELKLSVARGDAEEEGNPLTKVEVEALVFEEIDSFFDDELELVVCTPP